MQPSFDQSAAHRYFSSSCFNAVWDLLDKPNRTADDDEQMIALAHASVWHWTQRDDCVPQNLSVGYSQLSRVYAVLGLGDRARHYGELCLAQSRVEAPFYLGYAHEALARAALVLGDGAAAREHLAIGRRLADSVSAAEDQKLLRTDLDDIQDKTDHELR